MVFEFHRKSRTSPQVWGAEVLKAFGSGGGGDDGAPSGRAAVQAPLPEPASAAGAPVPESHLLVRSCKNR